MENLNKCKINLFLLTYNNEVNLDLRGTEPVNSAAIIDTSILNFSFPKNKTFYYIKYLAFLSVAKDLAKCWTNMVLLYAKIYKGAGKVYIFFGGGYHHPHKRNRP